MDRERRRLASILVVATGVLASHGLAYVLAHPEPVDRAEALAGHGYLRMLTPLAVPLAAVALGRASIRAARTTGAADHLTIGRLAVWQAAVFVVQELVERIAGGDVGGVLHEPAVAVGLLLQIPVAAALVGLVRVGRRVASGAPAGPTPTVGRSHRLLPIGPAGVRTATGSTPLSPLTRRGPPALPLID